MLVQELIRKKRDKHALTATEIKDYINGVTDKSVSESQIAAMSMAIFLNGLSNDERVNLTMAMAHSGKVVDWEALSLDGPVLDKHSTGGVGDKVSLMLAPIIAACGGYVPMISGRGLGHTGGTLDKMDSIPGYISQPDLQTLEPVVKKVGCAIVGATHDIAPADRTIYAVRDVTGTVESLDLITASILSKKLAAGLNGLVMDVKFGTGAFMQDYEDAVALAQSIVRVSNGAGLKCTALMTDMNQCLGTTAGNAIEVRESIEFLRGDVQDPRLRHVVLSLCADLLTTGGIADSIENGMVLAAKHLDDGRAADFFARMVESLGGPSDIIENYQDHLELAPKRVEIHPEHIGVVKAINTRDLGIAVIELGGGRRKTEDVIDHSVGLGAVAAIGETVGPSERPLAVIYGTDDAKIERAAKLIRNAYDLAPSGTKIDVPPIVKERITG